MLSPLSMISSTSSTRCPMRASPAARLTVVVVLPTPPFWLAMQKMRDMMKTAREE